VDGRGCWSLAVEVPAAVEELEGLGYAVVDIETTGGSPDRGHRITEIAVVEIRDGVIEEDFQTLVNPGREIPPRISALTGITNEMVATAPFFEDVAEDLFEWLEERVFVAHNVSFDWRFVSAQLGDAIGFVPQTPRLCTVQLARRLAPELPRRNLDSVARHFGVPVHSRHRAYGDAMATARIFLRLLDEARALGIRDLTALQLLLHRKGRS
jgi:DNA polymerase-3 subunit epsilon